MTNELLLPAAFAHGLVPSGLTAPGLRMALVLAAAASRSTGAISVMKPHLERDASVRLDNADRSLERLRTSTIIDIRGQAALLFDELNYLLGEKNRLAGIITGQLSYEAREAMRHGPAGTISISVDELGRLSTLPGILLLMRLAADRPNGDFRFRMDEAECDRTFGPYISRATIVRTNAAGNQFQWTALSRIFRELIQPGVKDLWTALDGFVVDAVPGVPATRGFGNAWSYIDITLKRLQPRKSMRELAELTRAHEEYSVRKLVPRRGKPSRVTPG